MNICLVSIPKISPHNGGVENVCYNLAQQIADAGEHKVYSLYVNKDITVPELPQITYHTLSEDYAERAQDTITDLHQFIYNNKLDIIWVHTPQPLLSSLIKQASENTSARIISIYHSAPTTIISEIGDRHDLYLYRCRYHQEFIPYLFLLLKLPLSFLKALRKTRNTLRNIFQTSDVVSLLSARYIDEFVRLSGCKDRTKLSYVTNPILTPEPEYNAIEKKNQIIVVCRHEWKHKRLDRMLRIWQKLQHLFPDWGLVILGDGPAHQEYQDDAKRLNLQRVTFTGKQKPDSYYAESKIICMTSSWEGLPMVLLEAQRYGCVPIAYESFAALRDIITPGETGFCIPPFKQGDYIQALQQLMQDNHLWLQMSRKNVEHAAQFTIGRVVAKWLDLFQSLTSR